MTIFLRELKRNSTAFIIWTIAIILLIFSQMAVFPQFIEDSAVAQDALLSKYPAALVDAFGIDRTDMSNVVGYYAVKIFPLLALIGSIYIILLATGILTKEKSEKTIEFLLSKPVTRNSIITSKLLCIWVYTLLFNLALYGASLGMIHYYNVDTSYNVKAFIMFYLSLILLNLAFASIGFFISVFISQIKVIYPVSIGAILGSYMISVIASSNDKLDSLKYLSFFKYSDAASILENESLEAIYLFLYAAVIIIPTIATYLFYSKKHITV